MTGLGPAKGKHLVAVMPHPDDESYSCAGALALAADAGAKVTLITATRGESGWVRDPAVHGHLPIAELRARELATSCRALGIRGPRFLDWPDGGVDGIDASKRRDQLVAVLDDEGADVVITLAADGTYGHRDHAALTQTCLQACGDRRLLLADFPRGVFEPLARRFVRHAGQFLVPELEPGALGLEPGTADIELDVGSAAARKRAAIAAHDSQLESAEPLIFLMPGLVERVCESEWYTIARGAPDPTIFEK